MLGVYSINEKLQQQSGSKGLEHLCKNEKDHVPRSLFKYTPKGRVNA
jgi:hypothetical protein